MEHTNGMNGKVVLITGGTSGIGKAAAVDLAGMGAEVVITGRSAERGREAVEEIKGRSASDDVSLLLADLSVQAEVRRLAEEFRASHDRLDVLVNNAGVVNQKRSETADGIESTLALNHLAPFLLTELLMDLLKGSAPSRIITTASEAERWGRMNFDDLQSRKRYGAFPVYGMTKLANIMFTMELAEKLEGTGVTATCFHPGAVSTNFGSGNGGLGSILFNAFKPFMRSPEKGAETLVHLASSPDVEGMTGKYLSDLKLITAKSVAYDAEARRKLWEASEKLTGTKVPA